MISTQTTNTSPSIHDINLPKEIRKGIRKYTQRPIAHFVFTHKLSPKHTPLSQTLTILLFLCIH